MIFLLSYTNKFQEKNPEKSFKELTIFITQTHCTSFDYTVYMNAHFYG